MSFLKKLESKYLVIIAGDSTLLTREEAIKDLEENDLHGVSPQELGRMDNKKLESLYNKVFEGVGDLSHRIK